MSAPQALWTTLRGDLKKSAIGLAVMGLLMPVCSVTLVDGDRLAALAWKSKRLLLMKLPASSTSDTDTAQVRWAIT